MQTHLPKIGLFIDADNAPASQVNFIMTDIAKYGIVTIKRAYGNWQKPCLNSWAKCLSKHAIQPVQQFDVVKGKNASDIALTISLVDSLHIDDIDLYVIVSSDSDFTALVTRIRATGKQVYGYGQRLACSAFVASCTKFIYYTKNTLLSSKSVQNIKTINKIKAKVNYLKLDDSTSTIKSAIEATAMQDGWSNVTELCKHITKHSSYEIRRSLHPSIGNIIHSSDGIETRYEENKTKMFVRINNN
ncbi:NYN domain-containing protein [Thalassotalea fonticola]|uniref:NYN domain-containing protein n=1 Tax=Thalassotalea fonticola TaxID=3065649 RepID=A0ABZ0GPJ4_9GAMM|nr:NYN domain-containing protein [Colwelliaceae bacterium S1-1]